MTTLHNDLTDVFGKSIFGDDLFKDVFGKVKLATGQSYPPYNIVKLSDIESRVEVALAGFRKSEIEVSTNDNILKIAGSQEKDSDSKEYAWKGISSKDFILQLSIADYVEVLDAKMEDGILQINLIKNIPEEKLPKKIEIK